MKEGWEYRKLGEVCSFFSGFAFKSSLFKNEGMPIIRISDIQNNELDDRNVVYFNPDDYKQDLTKYIVYPGEILIAMSGGTTGKIGKNNTNKQFYLNQRVGAFRENKSIIEHDYLYYYLYTKSEESLRIAAGAAQPNLSTAQIKDYIIPVPPLSEQQRIVTYLDSSFSKIDELKENVAKELSDAKALFQAELKKCMEKKEGWEEKTLGEVGTLKRGGNFSKKDFVENGHPCVHYGQIHMKFGIRTNQHLSSVPEEMVKKDRCAKKGDLIIAITSEDDEGSCKCTAWMGNYDVYVGGHTAIFTHSLDPVFMSYYFCSPRFQKEKLQYTHGFKVVEMNPKDIAKIPIAYPSLNEQHQIVTHLDTLSQKIQELEKNYNTILAECDALKQAILRETFE